MALENYLERTKYEIPTISFCDTQDNLSAKEREALKKLRANTKVNIKKGDKGNTTVVMDTQRKIVSRNGGPTERISSFIDSLLQPIAKKQESYIKDTTDFVRFIENTPIPDNAIIATLDVCSLYTNIPQEEGIKVVCKYYN